MSKSGCIIIGVQFAIILCLATAVLLLLQKNTDAVTSSAELRIELEALKEKAKAKAEPPTVEVEEIYDQYFDAEKAFAKDELFAMTSKETIPALDYVDPIEKNLLGNPKQKRHPAVYTVRFLGRETRENYIFIVPLEFYQKVKLHQKFTKPQLSNYEFFLSEERLHNEIFHRRFRQKMID